MNKSNPMKSILMVVGLAIVIFLAVTGVSMHFSVKSNEKLQNVKDLYFPVLERSDALLTLLDKMQEGFLNGVMTGEASDATNAADLWGKGEQIFKEMEGLFPQKKQEIQTIKEEARQYKDLALTVSMEIINKTGTATGLRTAQMNESQKKLMTHLKNFRAESYSAFTMDLSASQNAVKINVYMGVALGLMNLAFMGVLVHLMKSNLNMLKTIEEQNATLELKVEERTAALAQKTNDINAMLQNMKLGVCAVVPGNKLHPELSEHMHVLFESRSLADQDVVKALFDQAHLSSDIKDQIGTALSAMVGEDEMMFDCNAHLLPQEAYWGAENKLLQMSWSPIISDQGLVEKVLMIAQDITHVRALEAEAAQQKEELDMISQMIQMSVGQFNEFVESAQKMLMENHVLLLNVHQDHQETISALFRNMHTLKGNARTYQLKGVTNKAHQAEQEYDRLRKNPEESWDVEKLIQDLNEVEAALNEYVSISENKLGRKGRASDVVNARGAFVGAEDLALIKEWFSKASEWKNEPDFHALKEKVEALGLIGLDRVVSGVMDGLSSLAQELDKPVPQYELKGEPVKFNHKSAEALKSSLMHMSRNSLDHGIEKVEERQYLGKRDSGTITIEVLNVVGQDVCLKMFDDGRGLAIKKLEAKGRAAGLYEGSLSSQDDALNVARLIFNAGLSTAEEVTQVSGRGVGMDAVKMLLEETGGSIDIQLKEEFNGQEFMAFEFVIQLPKEAV